MLESIMIIDAYNMFIKNYVVDPSLSPQGFPIGGTKGFLKSLQKLLKDLKPSFCSIVWDGQGGSKRKRQSYKNYKEGRKPLQLNRNVDQDLSQDELLENRVYQFKKIIEYLNLMPVSQLMIDDVEADDVIGHMCSIPELKDKKKVIVSSDKDFFQLCDENTVVYRTTQNEVVNREFLLNVFNIHPNNFALARSIVGDTSDNIQGIKGAGLKVVAKRFPFLKEEKIYTIDEVISFATQKEGKIKIYNEVKNNKELIETNYKLSQLYSPSISYQNAQVIKSSIIEFKPEFNRTKIHLEMIRDGFVDYKWDFMFMYFRNIVDTHLKS